MPPTQVSHGPPPTPAALPTSASVLETSSHSLEAARALQDLQKAQKSARIREAIFAGEITADFSATPPMYDMPDRWRALAGEFEYFRKYPAAVITNMMDGIPKVAGLPRIAEWHPVLDAAASGTADAKLRTFVRDDQHFVRRILQVLAVLHASASADQRAMIDTAVVLIASHSGRQLDHARTYFLARAQERPPVDLQKYLAKEREMAADNAPSALGSSLDEFQDWADMQELGFVSSSSTTSQPAQVFQRRHDRRRNYRKGAGNVVKPAPAPAPAPAKARSPSPSRGRGRSHGSSPQRGGATRK